MHEENEIGLKAGQRPHRDKHLGLWDEISRLEEVEDSIQALLQKAIGSEEPETARENTSSPPLSLVLSQGAEAIGIRRERAMKLLAELEEVLF